MNAPLEGLRVVELATSVAGPYTTLVLAALGAEVVKIERPDGGDEARGWQPPSLGDTGVMFATMNAGKRSVVADLSVSADAESVRELAVGADVVVTSLRQSSLRRVGLDAAAIRARRPEVIHCRISAFGNQGPLTDEPGYDPLIQAYTGIMAVTGEDGRPPVRVGTSIVDMGTGMWSVIAILSALNHLEKSGEGATIDTALLETGVAWLPYQLAAQQATGDEPRRLGSGLPMLSPYQAFATADDYLVIAAGNDRMWQRLCAALDRPDLAGDPELATNAQRVAARERVAAELSTTLAGRPALEWEAILRDVKVPCSVVRTVGSLRTDEQVLATGILGPVGEVDMAGLPFQLDGWRPRPSGMPPALASSQSLLTARVTHQDPAAP